MLNIHSILDACLKKDRKAEYAMYKACHAFMFPICLRYKPNRDDALDLFNRSFLKIIQNLEQYDREKSFEKWSKKILVNTIIDEHRKNKNYTQHIELKSSETFLDEPVFDLNLAEDKLNTNDILKEIQRLPEPSRNILNLFVFEGLTHEEISASLGISAVTSRWHLRNARIILKQKLSKILGRKKE